MNGVLYLSSMLLICLTSVGLNMDEYMKDLGRKQDVSVRAIITLKHTDSAPSLQDNV